MTGGLVGALIGSALDSGGGRRDNSNNLSNIYIDQLTGEYTFEK
ncbi:hypothetical protein QFZ37_000595 [Chryseobacterium ginsenosidimutans]|nr:hypothetical protein [Chryseobacterium ginsenosidimutans]MDQ0592226.1 hypothetical protein [Chryseobacterium ginsenosidimutans]